MSNGPGCDDEKTDTADTESNIRGTDLSLNAILELLTHHHRRELLRELIDDPDHTANLDEITTILIDREIERTGKRPGRTEIETQLHHIHLPKLTNAGIVEYDTRSKEVRYRRHERLEDVLEYLSG